MQRDNKLKLFLLWAISGIGAFFIGFITFQWVKRNCLQKLEELDDDDFKLVNLEDSSKENISKNIEFNHDAVNNILEAMTGIIKKDIELHADNPELLNLDKTRLAAVTVLLNPDLPTDKLAAHPMISDLVSSSDKSYDEIIDDINRTVKLIKSHLINSHQIDFFE